MLQTLPTNRAALAEPDCSIPDYLQRNYWWAYVHPWAVALFERQWLVNTILWGNFKRLRDAALSEFGASIAGHTLQVACVYGDFSARLAERISRGSTLDIVDILPIQLQNLRRKLSPSLPFNLHLRDSIALGFPDASFDQSIIFFLLHEQPAEVRRKTLAESIRVLKPGGKLVVVDYHCPHRAHPLRYLLRPVLRALEPDAMDLWTNEIDEWLPSGLGSPDICKKTFFGGLYQMLVINVPKQEE
jgi:ubiquinone/menaquinone biosynthesis C-methylase UbiE